MLHHGGGLQVLMIAGIVGPRQGERGLVVKGAPLPFYRLLRLRQQFHHLAPPVAALRAS
jgi:hypothetical protein